MNINLKIKKLARDECACYSLLLNSIKDYCDREYNHNYRCLLFQDIRCGYFERAVLPMNPQLEALYKAKKAGYELPKEDEENISPIKGKVQIHCKKCGKPFQADNYRSQYCGRCKRYVRRESKRKWIENKRDVDVDNQLSKTVDM